MLRKLPIIGVLGSGSPIAPDRAALAYAVGAMVARLDAHLLTGAGYGVMAAAAEGFVAVEERQGLSIGMVPRDPAGPINALNHTPDGRPYPNPYVEIAVFTALPPRAADWRSAPSRNHVNVLTAHALVALPGAVGTSNELEMAAELGPASGPARADRRTILIGPREEFPAAALAAFLHAASLEEARRHLTRMLRPSFVAMGGAPA
ncbi:MAG: SLOG cluster 4 domain-containing protein [Rhodoplanes sp.]